MIEVQRIVRAPMSTISAVAESQPSVRLRAAVAGVSVIVGVLISTLWSATLVDSDIGFHVADKLVGYNADAKPISGMTAGIFFAFASGLAGSFTACNIAGLSAIGPLSVGSQRTGDLWKPLAWLGAGACGVAGLYGAIGALIGTGIPQLSSATVSGFPVRLLQSSIVFGVIGLVLLTMGLARLGIVRHPLQAVFDRHPRAEVTLMGMMIGAFLIGRPYPLFFKLFTYAASTHNPLFGAGAFVLQTLGNIIVMSVLFVTLARVVAWRAARGVTVKRGRAEMWAAGALLVAGAFAVSYWSIKLPAQFGFGWWPKVPWS